MRSIENIATHTDISLSETRNTIFGLSGDNFSGRTDILKDYITNLTQSTSSPKVARCRYIGPEIYNCLSGLSHTVSDEINLWKRHRHSEMGPIVEKYLPAAKFGTRNPFTLSGGEQAFLVAYTSFLQLLDVVIFDCSLEQIDVDRRHDLLLHMRRQVQSKNTVAIADNRLDMIDSYLDKIYNASDVRPSVRINKISPVIRKNEYIAPNDCEPITINIRKLSHTYDGAFYIFKNASTTLVPGRVYHLKGSNGSGKSTLAKILAGLIRPKECVVEKNNDAWMPWKFPAEHVAYHFQNPDVQLFSTTVRAELNSSISTVATPSDDTAESVADIFGLKESLDLHPFDLPFVMRKRLALATAFAMRRPWLILDEPTLGQDVASTHAISSLINAYARSNGVIIISHDELLIDLLNSKNLYISDRNIS